MKRSLRNLGLACILTASLIIGIKYLAMPAYADNKEQKDLCPEVTRIMGRTDYSRKKVEDMLYKTFDEMIKIPDQSKALTEEQNYKMKKEIAKKMLYDLGDKFGNKNHIVDDDLSDILLAFLNEDLFLNEFIDQYVGNNDGKTTHEEKEKMNRAIENKKFPGVSAITDFFNYKY